jgi:NADH:ubiquinone reductase (H+-translocating)
VSRPQRPHILVIGGGYVGMYTALRLQRRLKAGEASITVVDPLSYMTYQPFLPEAGAGNLEPRHVVVPLRRVLRRCQVLSGRITRVDHARRTARF